MNAPQQPTPLRTGQMGLVRTPGASADAIRAIIEESRAWGLLGFDLEWVTLEDETRVITWCGLGHAGRAVSLWWPTLPEESRQPIKDAIKDPMLAKLAHNVQADILTWEMNFGEGAVGGLWEDTMLIHHAACPGVAHGLQEVTSQYLVVPPWKTWHRDAEKAKKEADKQAVAAAKKADKEAAKAEKEAERAAAKIEKLRAKLEGQCNKFLETYPESETIKVLLAKCTPSVESSEEEFTQLAADIKAAIPEERDRIKAERKAAKAAAHEAKNAAAKAKKEAEKAAKQQAHEERNAKAAAEKEAKKLFRRQGGAPEGPDAS